MLLKNNILKGEILANGYTQKELASKINLDVSTLNRYLNSDLAKMPIGIAQKIVNTLSLDDFKIRSIFF